MSRCRVLAAAALVLAWPPAGRPQAAPEAAGGPAPVLLWGDQGDGTYRNPVLNADYSDPDVIRVGDDFYLVLRGRRGPVVLSLDGRSWVEAGAPFALRFGHWKGARFGVFSYGAPGDADFDYLRYRYGMGRAATP
jgi:hypothetical protein